MSLRFPFRASSRRYGVDDTVLPLLRGQPLGAAGKAVANAMGAAPMSPPADAPPVPDPAVSRARVPVTWSDC